ncbi:MAG: hypothetical protein TREMPRED_005902 [Tremellales sp. Tagirdzhanova-0007]|nr:MAG: hypothetical protein TREMPRED_005902 [Tremellales sp. Tagirdzhanova-0007]
MQFAIIGTNDGNYLLGQIAANASTTVTFSFLPATLPNSASGGTTSFFSEIGPTDDLHMAPSVLATGTNIVSILPTALGNWSLTEGTSQACAFTSGSVALYLNAKGVNNVTPKKVREALQFSAIQVPVTVSGSDLESVAAQGAGKIQIFDAINSGTIVSPTELLLNDTAYFQGIQYITVTNSAQSQISYKLSNLAAGTALALQSNQSNAEPVPQVPNAASVWISQSSFTLRPGQSNLVILKFTAPSGLDPTTLPVYSGWIQIVGGSNAVQVPYMGVATKMRSLPVIDPTAAYLGIDSPTILDSTGNVQSGTTSYNFRNGDFPTVLYRLVSGTPLLLIDLIRANSTLGFTPNYNSRKRSVGDSGDRTRRAGLNNRRVQPSGQASNVPFGLLYLLCRLTHNNAPGCSSNGTNTFSQIPILGNLYEADYIPRNTDNADGQGNDYGTYALQMATFSNGTAIPDGTYKCAKPPILPRYQMLTRERFVTVLLRALHITGETTNESDYEAWVSEPFTISQ